MLSEVKVTQLCLTLWDPVDCSLPGSRGWNSPSKNTRMGCHSLFQGIFLTQGSNLGLPQCRQIFYCLSHQNIKKIKYVCGCVYIPAHKLLEGNYQSAILIKVLIIFGW